MRTITNELKVRLYHFVKCYCKVQNMVIMNKRMQKIITSIYIFTVLLTFSPVVFAGGNVPTTTAPNPSSDWLRDIGAIIGLLYNILYPVAIIYGILQIILAGYGIMKSEGNPKVLDTAKENLTSSIIGVLFVMLAVIILRIIIKAFLYNDITI